jgi:hypothetical protein
MTQSIRTLAAAAAFLPLMMLSAPVPAQAPDADDRIAEQIRAADRNGDGEITRNELWQSRIPPLRNKLRRLAERQLERFDADGDGKLTAAELTEARIERLRALWSRRFDALDTDGSGALSAGEIRRPGQ